MAVQIPPEVVHDRIADAQGDIIAQKYQPAQSKIYQHQGHTDKQEPCSCGHSAPMPRYRSAAAQDIIYGDLERPGFEKLQKLDEEEKDECQQYPWEMGMEIAENPVCHGLHRSVYTLFGLWIFMKESAGGKRRPAFRDTVAWGMR